ncbi:MAG: hypothetical protein NTZ73_04155 [Candidatus Diapherotrites archaeon]|nr:hypothetical protein [Candidatus Diapherotrites archaeon]
MPKKPPKPPPKNHGSPENQLPMQLRFQLSRKELIDAQTKAEAQVAWKTLNSFISQRKFDKTLHENLARGIDKLAFKKVTMALEIDPKTVGNAYRIVRKIRKANLQKEYIMRYVKLYGTLVRMGIIPAEKIISVNKHLVPRLQRAMDEKEMLKMQLEKAIGDKKKSDVILKIISKVGGRFMPTPPLSDAVLRTISKKNAKKIIASLPPPSELPPI